MAESAAAVSVLPVPQAVRPKARKAASQSPTSTQIFSAE